MRPRRWLPVLTGLIASVVLPRLVLFPVVTTSPDEITYAMIGRAIWDGDWPYTVLFDHKPVALYLPYALATGLGGETVTALRYLSLVVAAVAYVATYAVSRRLGASVGVATTGAVVLSLLLLGNGGVEALSEPLVVAYVLGIVLLLLLRRGVWTSAGVGALIALTVQTNYLSGALCGALGGWFLWRERHRPLQWAAAGVGFVIMFIATLLPVLLRSDIGDYLTLQLRFLAAYSPPPDRAGTATERWAAMVQPTLPLLALAALLAAVSPAARSRAATRWAALLLAVLAVISVNGFAYPHYAMLLAVPLTFLLVTQLRDLEPPVGPWVIVVVIGVAVWSLLPPQASVFATGARSMLSQRSLAPDRSQPDWVNAATVAELARPGEVVYSPNVELYYLSRTRPPIRFFFPDHHLNAPIAEALGTSVTAQMEEVVAAAPVAVVIDPVFVLPPEALEVLTPYLRENCHLFRVTGHTEVYDCR